MSTPGRGTAGGNPAPVIHIGPLIPAGAPAMRYAAAVAIVLVIFLVRSALAPLLGVQAPLLPFLLGVLAAAYLGGRGPAILASLLTPVLATWGFTDWPNDAPPGQRLAHVTFFLVLAVLSALMMDALQSAVRRAAANAASAAAAARQLQEANQRKDEFLAMLAHELRNPLTPIRNLAHILARGPDPAAVRRAAEVLTRQSSHLTRLVDDLLDVARITHRRVELKRGVVSLEDVLAMALESVHSTLEERRQIVTSTVTDANVHVDGDVVRLCQVVTNLLSNASRFSPEGGRIHVNVGGDNTQGVVSVRDEGQGIDAQLLPRLFDLFEQGDRSLDRAQGGLGIGLTIVKHLVEMHGGTVEATSAGLGQGSEFRVRLPRVPAPAVGPRTLPQPLLRQGRRKRVLIIEDDVDVADSLHDLLIMEGHEVVVMRDGPAGLSKLDDFAADVVLLDVGLPRMDGYMVAHAIRARFENHMSRPRIIALTGYARPEDRHAALRSGFDDHLGKPVDPVQLLQALAEELGAPAARADES